MSLVLCAVSAADADSVDIVLGDKGDRGSAVEAGDPGPRPLLREGGDIARLDAVGLEDMPPESLLRAQASAFLRDGRLAVVDDMVSCLFPTAPTGCFLDFFPTLETKLFTANDKAEN